MTPAAIRSKGGMASAIHRLRLLEEHGQEEDAAVLRSILVEAHYPLALAFIKKTLGNGSFRFTREDALQYAIEGLYAALNKFDPSRGFLFSTYATWWMRHRVMRERRGSPTVKIPIWVWDRKPEDIAALRIYSLDGATNPEDPDSPTWMELQEGDVPDPEAVHAERELQAAGAKAVAAIDKLPERWQFIIRQRFLEGKTLKQVGDILGVSRERVRQLQVQALELLRERLGEEWGEEQFCA